MTWNNVDQRLLNQRYENNMRSAILNLAEQHASTPSKPKSQKKEEASAIDISTGNSTNDESLSDTTSDKIMKKEATTDAPKRPRTILKTPSQLANSSIASTRVLIQPEVPSNKKKPQKSKPQKTKLQKTKLQAANESDGGALKLQDLFIKKEIMLPLDVTTAVYHEIDSGKDQFLTMDEYVSFLHESTFHQQVDFSKHTLCLMTGHNDSTSQMTGGDLKGWLAFELKDYSQGICAGRVQFRHGSGSNLRNEGLGLKAPSTPLPDDMMVQGA